MPSISVSSSHLYLVGGCLDGFIRRHPHSGLDFTLEGTDSFLNLFPGDWAHCVILDIYAFNISVIILFVSQVYKKVSTQWCGFHFGGNKIVASLGFVLQFPGDQAHSETFGIYGFNVISVIISFLPSWWLDGIKRRQQWFGFHFRDNFLLIEPSVLLLVSMASILVISFVPSWWLDWFIRRLESHSGFDFTSYETYLFDSIGIEG